MIDLEVPDYESRVQPSAMLRLIYSRVSILVVLTSLLLLQPTLAQIRYVQSGAAGDGLTTATPSGSLTAMLSSLSATGGTVLVGGGLYTPTSTTVRTVSFSIASGVQVFGGYNVDFTTRALPGQPGSTTLSGNIGNLNAINDNSFHVVRFRNASANTRLDGVVVTGGNASSSGVDARGGGLYNDGGGTGNISIPVISQCWITSNTAGTGGGLYNFGQGGNSSPTLLNCLFAANHSTATFFSSGGSALYNDGRNSGRSSPLCLNCTFSGNTIASSSGFPGVGRVLLNDGRTSGSSSVTLVNCIVWNNGGDNAFVNNTNGSVTVRYCLIEPEEPDYNTTSGTPATLTNDPLFVGAAGSNFRLRACSPAVNSGDPTATQAVVGTIDLDGQARFYNAGRIDMGAFELQTDPDPALTITTQPPAGSTVCAGSDVTVAVSFSGTATSIQWFRGSTALTGQASTSLTLTNVTSASVGTYRAALTGACNSVTSSGFVVALAQPVGITSQPSLGSLPCPGGTATVTVSASGTGPLAYQWFKDGVPLTSPASATTASLSLPNLSGADAGQHRAVVTGRCNSVTSTAISVAPRPTVLYVTPTGAGLADGSSVDNALSGTALRTALTTACTSSTFLIGSGLYTPTTGTDRSLSFLIPSGIQVYGGYDATFTTRTTNPGSTTFSGEIGSPISTSDNSFHVVRFQDANGSTRLDGVVITSGNANGSTPDLWGGGIYIDGSYGGTSTPIIANCQLVNNAASSEGGGLYNNGTGGNASPTLTNCVFLSNSAISNGGGISSDGTSSGVSRPQIRNSLFQNNIAGTFAGAIYNNASNPAIDNCTLVSNTAGQNGGGVYGAQSSVTLINSRLTSNSARFGGGVYQTNQALLITDCTFTSNSAAVSGGGLHANLTSLTVLRSTFLTNQSSSNGGAYTSDGGSAVFNRCRFTGNHSVSSGGVMYLLRGTVLSATNSEFFNNESAFGGVIYNSNTAPTLTNCTLFGNRAASGGQVIYSFSTSVGLSNCVVWNNGGQNAFVINSGATVEVSYGLIEAGETNFVIANGSPSVLTSDPRFADAPNGNLRPTACSPTIDVGDPNTTSTLTGSTDLDGQPRFFGGGRIDIGAYEFQGQAGPVAAIATQPPSGSVLCAGQALSVPISTSGAVNSIQWFRNGTMLNGQTGPTLSLTNVQPADAGSYSAVVMGCQNSLTSTAFSLTVNLPPTSPSLTLTGATTGPLTCTLTSVTLAATATNGVSYTLSDGQQNTTGRFVVSASGPYSVSIGGAAGCSTPITATATVQSNTATPLVSLSASSTSFCTGSSVTLSADGGPAGGPFGYVFSGPGLSQSGNSPTATVNQAGVYSVTVTGANGCTAGPTSVSLTSVPLAGIVQPPSAGSVVCAGGAVTVFVSTSGTVNQWQWYKDGAVLSGQTSATLAVPSTSTTSSGSYRVEISGICNSLTSTAFTLTVNPLPTNPALTGGTLTCAQPSLTLTASATNGAIFAFSGGTPLGPNQVVVNQSGPYAVTISTASGCTATASTVVSSNTAISAQLVPSTPGVCAGTSLILTGSGGDAGATYIFSGPGLNQRGLSKTASITQTGTYALTVTGTNGCTATTSLSLNVALSPVVNLFFLNNNTVLQATGGVAYERKNVLERFNGYEIREVDTSLTGFFVVNRPGPFTVTVTGANGCKTTVAGTTP